MTRLVFLIMSIFFVSTAYGELTITTKIVDRMEYEGIAKSFCSEVGHDALDAKRKKTSTLKFTYTVTEALERNQNYRRSQRNV